MQVKLSSILIRSWSLADAPALARYANNRNVSINLRDIFPYPYTLENAEAFLNHATREKPETTFAIATSTEPIGGIGLRLGVDIHRKTAELGYWLAEPFWSRGIMSEVVSEFVRVAFDTFDLQRIYAEPFATNRASIRVLEKASFTFEGRMRANVFKDGRTLDSLLYARTRDDTAQERKSALQVAK
jgi:[ribosomal protein S5]-alanine N-acetyltransferase